MRINFLKMIFSQITMRKILSYSIALIFSSHIPTKPKHGVAVILLFRPVTLLVAWNVHVFIVVLAYWELSIMDNFQHSIYVHLNFCIYALFCFSGCRNCVDLHLMFQLFLLVRS